MGLHRSPFSIQVEQDFYYPFQSFEQRLTILQRLVQGRDFLILVIGEKGSGKTMLLKRFLSSANSDWRRCRILAKVSNSNRRKLKLNNLDNHPAYILQDSTLPIVLFDDAHELTTIELQYLLKDAMTPDSNRKLKRLILFCEPQIKSAMAEISSSIDSVTTINKLYMPGLNEKETSEYLIHRLGIAGFRGKNPFKPTIIKSVYRISNGLPGFINLEAHKILQQKYSKRYLTGIFSLKNWTVKKIVGCIGMLLMFAIVFEVTKYYLSNQSNEIINEILTDKNASPIYIPEPSSTKKADTQIQKSDIKKKTQKNTKSKTLPPILSKEPSAALNAGQSRKRNLPQKDKKLSLPKRQFVKTGNIYREDWLLVQNPSNYTIQIIGVRKKDALVEFINRHNLPSKAKVAFYQTEYKGAPWFQAVYGIYPTRKEARTAIQNLPPEIHKLSPWIRRVSSVKSNIMNKKVR